MTGTPPLTPAPPGCFPQTPTPKTKGKATNNMRDNPGQGPAPKDTTPKNKPISQTKDRNVPKIHPKLAGQHNYTG